MPAIVFTSVDFPAPLSPTSATTSPAWTSKSTSLSAWTGPKLLLTPSSARTGVLPFELILRRLLSAGLGAPIAGAPNCSPQDLLDASLLASGCVLAGADLVHRPEPVLDDRVLDVVHGDRDRLEQDRRHLLRAIVDLVLGRRRGLALGELDGELRRLLRLRLDRLVDGHVLLTREDPLDRRELRVLTRRRDLRRVDPVALHRGDGAAGG